MRFIPLFLLVSLGFCFKTFAQPVDIASAKADPKTFIFDDKRHTVHGYVYAQLKEQTTCCGNDAIYLEVKFNQQGKVTSAKTLTGKSDCYKKSVVDIIQNVTWDATGVRGIKTIYFEVKPIIPCSGSPNENQYKPVGTDNGSGVVADAGSDDDDGDDGDMADGDNMGGDDGDNDDNASTSGDMNDGGDAMADNDGDDDGDDGDDDGDDDDMEDGDAMADNDSDDDGDDDDGDDGDAMADNGSGDDDSGFLSSGNDTEMTANRVRVTNSSRATNTRRSSGGKIPPQADFEYVSKGDRRPEDSHAETHVNVGTTEYRELGYHKRDFDKGSSQIGVAIRKTLKKNGFCGLAQAAVEVTVDPNGSVVGHRVLAASDDKVREAMAEVVNSLKFKPFPGTTANSRNIFQFKTEIVCGEGESRYDLDKVPNIINRPVATDSE